jgi:hypothetical protein
MIANIGARWVDGNLEFYEIATGTTRLTIPAETTLDPLDKQAAVTSITTDDAGTQGETYAQADVQAIATLANANKAKINAILTALRAAGVIAE